MNKKVYAVIPFLSIALLIVLWGVGAWALNIEFLLPSPINTFKQLIGLFAESNFYLSVLGTTLHAILAFLSAFALAFLLAVGAYFSKIFERLLHPLTVVMRVMPTMSVIFLSLTWLSRENSPYLVCGCVLFPILYANVLHAFNSVDKDLITMSKLYGVTKRDMIKSLYIPSIASSLYNDCLTLLSFSVKLAISGEAIAHSKATVGFLLQSSKANLETGALIAYTIVAILLGFLMELIVKLIATAIRRKRYAKA